MTRLRRSDPSRGGYSRRRAGSGFAYRDASGITVKDASRRDRFARIGIPPAWTDVWISPHENGHIQATGVDDAGRRQYIYHPAWRERKDRLKFDRALDLAATLPKARAHVTRALRGSGGATARDRNLAAAFRLLDTGSLRIGSERYAQSNGSRGLATLLCKHAQVRGATVTLTFPAKSGKVWERDIVDPDLADFVREQLNFPPDASLLSWSGEGTVHALTSGDINAYVKERTGSFFTAKDFRTLRGTIAAAESLSRSGTNEDVRARRRAISQAVDEAARALGNTPAIARKSYVDPRVVDAYHLGLTLDITRHSAEAALRSLLTSASSDDE